VWIELILEISLISLFFFLERSVILLIVWVYIIFCNSLPKEKHLWLLGRNTNYKIFFIVTSLYPLTVGVEGYCCTWSHSMTHTHTLGRTPLEEVLTRRRHLYFATHNTHNTHNRAYTVYICPRQDSNPPAQQASGRRLPSYRYELQFLGENAYKYVKLAWNNLENYTTSNFVIFTGYVTFLG